MERSVFQHPQATHRVVLDGEAVAYLLRLPAYPFLLPLLLLHSLWAPVVAAPLQEVYMLPP